MAYTHVCTTIDQLNIIPIINEQVIFVTDTQQIYLDYNNIRNNVTIGSISYYQDLKEKMKYSATKSYSVGDICYYYNSFVAGSQPGWYIRSEDGVTPGIWNSNYWTELFDIPISEESSIINGYDFGENNLSFGEQSFILGKNNAINEAKYSFTGGHNNLLNENNSENVFIFGKNNIINIPSISSAIFGQGNQALKIDNTDYFDTSIAYFIEGQNNKIDSYGSTLHIEGSNNYIKNIKNSHIEGNYNIVETSTDDLKDIFDNTITFLPPLNIHVEGGGEDCGNYCKLNRESDNNIHIEGTNNIVENLTDLTDSVGEIGAHNVHIEGNNNILHYDTVSVKNINIYGKNNQIQVEQNGINDSIIVAGENNAIVQESYGGSERTSSVENLFLFGKNLTFSEQGRNYSGTHAIFGYYNDENLKTDYVFSIGTGHANEKKTSFGVSEDNIYFNNNVYFGQYELLSPMEELMKQFSDYTELDNYSPTFQGGAWNQYNTKGHLIYERNFEDFNDYLAEHHISWTHNIGSKEPLLWFVIECHKEIDDVDTKIGSILLQCSWAGNTENLSLALCQYKTCVRVQEVLQPEPVPAHWDDYSEWIEPDTIIEIYQNNDDSFELTYDPIVEIEILNKNYTNNTFSINLKLQPENPYNAAQYSNVQILNIQLPSGVSPDDIDNEVTLWSAGSPDYDIKWYNKKDICNGDYHNWPIIRTLQTEELLAPRADTFYSRGSLVIFNGLLYESQGVASGDNWFDKSYLPSEYEENWSLAFDRGYGWHKVINAPSEYERGRYYPTGDICFYTVTDIQLGDYTEYYLCNESYFAQNNPFGPGGLDPAPPENAYWTCISNNLELAQLDARITALENRQ